MKSIWLDRAMFYAPLYFGLVTTEGEFARALKKMGMPKEQHPAWIGPNAQASTHFFSGANVSKRGGPNHAAIVALPHKKRPLIEVHSVLCHEAVHIWQEVRKLIGEDKPCNEFEAYAVQNIAFELMCAYEQQTTRRRA